MQCYIRILSIFASESEGQIAPSYQGYILRTPVKELIVCFPSGKTIQDRGKPGQRKN